jgi:hypothetical protein
MDVKFKIERGKLKMSYRVYNGNARAIYLMNHLFSTDVSGKVYPDRNLAYATIIDGDTVLLAKWVPPLPEDLLTDEIRPYATIVAPGDSFGEAIELDLPLKLVDPYNADLYDGRASALGTLHKIVFCLGYYPYQEQIKAIEKEINSVKVISIGGIPAYGQGQSVLRSEVVRLPLSVVLSKSSAM